MNNLKAAVVGSGIGGLAIALRLRKLGFEVDVYEKNAESGGKIGELNADGFRFDTGPSLFTLPELADELFHLFNESDKIAYSKLDVVCRYFWNDGAMADSFANADKFAAELENQVKEPQKNIHRFLKYTQALYELSSDVFIFNSLHKLSTWTNPNLLRNAAKIRFLKPYTSMYRMLQKHFVQEKTRQLFSRYATYNGSNPYLAPSTLNVIAHLEHNLGAFFPDNGMYDIARKLTALAEKHGIKIHYNAEVQQILVENRQIKGVKVANQDVKYDLVASDVDIYTLKQRLLPELKLKYALDIELSTSGLIFYWGINQQFPKLKLHNILFSKNYRQEFEYLTYKQQIYADPTIYIFISQKHVKTDAPEGKENWFVMINTPADFGQNWAEEVQQARKNIVRKINEMLQTDIEPLIESESIATPRTIAQKTASFKGALYGKNSNSTMAAFKRAPNYSAQFKGLYFVGGSVHPGGGIPLALSSAKIAEEFIRKDFKL